MRISDWSSDVCSSDLPCGGSGRRARSHPSGFRPPRRSRRRSSADRAGSWRRSEERRVGKSVSVRVDLGGRRIIKKKNPLLIIFHISNYIYLHIIVIRSE